MLPCTREVECESAIEPHMSPQMPGDLVGSEGAIGKEVTFLVSGTVDVSAWVSSQMATAEVPLAEVQASPPGMLCPRALSPERWAACV